MSTSEDEMPILSTEETGELEMPRLEVEAETSPDPGPSTRKTTRPMETLQRALKTLQGGRLETVNRTFDDLYEKTAISDHDLAIKERAKQFESHGKNEVVLSSTVFPGLKYRFLLNGGNRHKTLRFYSCYSCIMIKKIAYYQGMQKWPF